MSVTATPAWQNLLRHREAVIAGDAATLIAGDPDRLITCDIAFGGLRLNYAFQRVDAETLALLTALAEQQGLGAWRARMFGGEKINVTEGRAVLHTALRRAGDRPPLTVDGVDVMPDIRAVQARIASFVDAVRTGRKVGATGKKFRHVVNIGIGGSDLGPRLAVQALKPFASEVESHFVANADAFDIDTALRGLDPAETLFVVVSKTFATQETLLNARTARQWVASQLGEAAVVKHFAAVSVNTDEVGKFGIAPEATFPMWDWDGGRFSLWSAVGLSVNLAIGNEHFADLLAGAAAMDAHFLTAPFGQNMPVMLAMLGIWNRNFLNMPALAILPYCERLRDLPRYLQQLEMESNGKSVTRDGAHIEDYDTAPALFGECGTVGQHSFHQWLHQGTTAVAADFIGVAFDDLNRPEHHSALLSNLAAQMGALAFGQSGTLQQHDFYPGGRPSNLIMLERLDPKRLGMMLALYEHKTFVQGIIWGINSFDQPGVELGKRMARHLATSDGDQGDAAAFMRKFYRSIAGNS